MRKIKDITEDEMIAVFLKAEIASTRWMDTIVGLIEKDGISRDIIDNPNVQSDEENAYRRKLFDVFRGHTKRTRLFGGFPKNVRWARKMINKRELERVKYIKWGIWSEITGGTRSPIDAAKNILSGKVDQNQTRQF